MSPVRKLIFRSNNPIKYSAFLLQLVLLDLVKPITVGFTFGRYFELQARSQTLFNKLNTRKNGKSAKLPRVKLDFARCSFIFGVRRFFNSLPLSLRNINSRVLFGKPRKIIPSDFYCSFSSF